MISSEQLSSALREIDFLGLTFSKEEIEAVAFGLSKTQDFQKSKYETLWDNIKKIAESHDEYVKFKKNLNLINRNRKLNSLFSNRLKI